MAFNTILRRGLGTRTIPPGPPAPIQFFFGVTSNCLSGSLREMGVSGGPFSADFSSDFGLGGSNGGAISVSSFTDSDFFAAGISAIGEVDSFIPTVGAIDSVSAITALGSLNVQAGSDRTFNLPAVSTVNNVGVIIPSLPNSIDSVEADTMLASLPTSVLDTGATVNTSGSIGAFTYPTVVVLNSGTSWTVPNGITNLILVECWGSGGQGGNWWGAPQGGGGGAYAAISNLTVTPNASLSIMIGTGGSSTSTTLYNGGVKGGDTWFQNTSTVLAIGGGGGSNAIHTSSANGGASSSCVGTSTFTGGTGSAAPASNGAGAGGGGAGPDGPGLDGNSGNGITGHGGIGDNASGGVGGAGHDGVGPQNGDAGIAHVLGGGGGGGAADTSSSGSGTGGAGAVPGGGGGGGNTAATGGGFGGNGQIRITY